VEPEQNADGERKSGGGGKKSRSPPGVHSKKKGKKKVKACKLNQLEAAPVWNVIRGEGEPTTAVKIPFTEGGKKCATKASGLPRQ